MYLQFQVQIKCINLEEDHILPKYIPCLLTLLVHYCVSQVIPRLFIFSNCHLIMTPLTITLLKIMNNLQQLQCKSAEQWLFFSLDTYKSNFSYKNRQRRSSFQHIGRSMGSFLPDRLTDMWEPSRHFASLKLPNVGVRSLVALSRY